MSCILRHRGVQLILAYSWARPAILVGGKGRGGMFLFLLFLHFHSCSSFFPIPPFHLFYYFFYLFSPFLWETTQNDPQGLTCRYIVHPNTINQSCLNVSWWGFSLSGKYSLSCCFYASKTVFVCEGYTAFTLPSVRMSVRPLRFGPCVGYLISTAY